MISDNSSLSFVSKLRPRRVSSICSDKKKKAFASRDVLCREYKVTPFFDKSLWRCHAPLSFNDEIEKPMIIVYVILFVALNTSPTFRTFYRQNNLKQTSRVFTPFIGSWHFMYDFMSALICSEYVPTTNIPTYCDACANLYRSTHCSFRKLFYNTFLNYYTRYVTNNTINRTRYDKVQRAR